MDGRVAIEANRQALKRIVATLVDMAGLGDGPEGTAESEPQTTLPRLLYLVILRLLRPAESAARRLVIAAARGLVVAPPPPRQPKPQTLEPLLRRFGIAIMMPPSGLSAVAQRAKADLSVVAQRAKADLSAVARRAKADGGGAPRVPAFPLFDPPRQILGLSRTRHHAPTRTVPRLWCPGLSEPACLPLPPSPDDLVSATRLTRRLAALAAALDDLPGQARRFAKWKARREADAEAGARRLSPLRRGRPPGGRLARYDPTAAHPRNIREIDEILAHAHALAVFALESPDTS